MAETPSVGCMPACVAICACRGGRDVYRRDVAEYR